MRPVGIHLRLQDALQNVYARALELQLSLFQCFFVYQSTGKLIEMSSDDINACKTMNSAFAMRIVHGSYFINLASSFPYHKALAQELSLAKKLEFTHMVLHPGSARGAQSHEHGIDFLARTLNKQLKKESDITLVLENTAHGGMSIGGNLEDFCLLKQKLDRPEKLKFCIDTAHAFSYGYDICTQDGQHAFFALLEKCIGIDNIVLLHMNDTYDTLGSKLDRHALPGSGSIGLDVLKQVVMASQVQHIPIIMEVPAVSKEEEQHILVTVRNWHD